MSRRMRSKQVSCNRKRVSNQCARRKQIPRRQQLRELVNSGIPEGTLFSKEQFHGSIKWIPELLAIQALIWSWQDTKKVTDAFEKTMRSVARWE